MMDFIGGFLFVPEDKTSLLDVIHVTLHTLSDPSQVIRVRLPSEGWLAKPVGASLADLYQARNGTVELHMFGLYGRVTFETQVSGYMLIGVQVAQSAFLGASPASIKQFRSHWISLCEQTQAEFGYFGNYPYELEEHYRDNEILMSVLAYNVAYLVEKDFWLTYLSPQMALYWRSHTPTVPHFIRKVESLPSGAIVLHGGRGDNAVSGEDLPPDDAEQKSS